MEAVELKQYIIDKNKIFEILEKLECWNIKDGKSFITASFPNGDNPKGININKENMSFNSFSRDLKGDIFSLVMYIKGIEFFDAIKTIHDMLGLKIKFKKNSDTKSFDPLELFKRIKSTSYSLDEIEDLNSYGEDVLNDYYPYLTKDWVIENGILECVRKRFNLGYSSKFNRIIIPHRYYSTGDIVGIIGRTLNPLYKELGVPKYFPILKYSKSNNLYGLYENYSDIQKKGYVVVYESEKSVIRRSARGDNTGVALCCKTMSRVQLKILKSLNVEVVISLDNDVSPKEILSMCDMFYPTHKVSFTKDNCGLLGKKESIADTTIDNFNKIFNNRNKYNDEWKKILNKLREDI